MFPINCRSKRDERCISRRVYSNLRNECMDERERVERKVEGRGKKAAKARESSDGEK